MLVFIYGLFIIKRDNSANWDQYPHWSQLEGVPSNGTGWRDERGRALGPRLDAPGTNCPRAGVTPLQHHLQFMFVFNFSTAVQLWEPTCKQKRYFTWLQFSTVDVHMLKQKITFESRFSPELLFFLNFFAT